MILITGGGGNTGKAVLAALVKRNIPVRVLVHREAQVAEMNSLGAAEVVVGDMRNLQDVCKAYHGVDVVYHICSVFNPDEVEIAKMAMQAAKEEATSHFVYHSVLHSNLSDLPHHAKKHQVEELLVQSDLPYTIVQPAAFMQNTKEAFAGVKERGVFAQKLFGTKPIRMNLLDLEDLGEAAVNILTDTSFIGGTYELCGPENLSLSDILALLQERMGRPVTAFNPPDAAMAENLQKAGKSDYFIHGILTMFHHYNEQGFLGNSRTLEAILGRKPHTYREFLERAF